HTRSYGDWSSDVCSSDLDCLCELSVWMFKKRKSLGCPCRKKKFGQPKLTVGIEYGPSKILAARRRWRAEALRWLRWNGDGDDLEIGRASCRERVEEGVGG